MNSTTPTPTPYEPSEEFEQAVAMHSAEDARQAALMPSTLPKGAKGVTFLVPELPVNEPFTLTEIPATGANAPDDGAPGRVLGPFQPDEFVTDPATNVTTAHDPDTGTPVVLCVLDQWPDPDEPNRLVLQVVHNDVDEPPVRYLVTTLPDNTVEIEL